jgi:parallel beta-helix repeat protein
MKLRPIAIAIAIPVATCSLLLAATLLTAGPLDPPTGAIAPTYKTLNEVEPRIPLSLFTTPGDADSVLRITTPGSYYLTGNLEVSASGLSAIEIAASNVTLDLSGYEIKSTTNAAVIRCSLGAATGITVRNGTVSGGQGIDLSPTSLALSQNGLVEYVTVENSSTNGIRAGLSYTINRCRVAASASDGIVVNVHSTVSNVTTSGNSGAGVLALGHATIIDSIASNNDQNGFSTDNAALISRCLASQNILDGFLVGAGSTIDACTARSNSGDGFDLSATTITGSSSYNNSTGVRAVESTISGCTFSRNSYGGECNRSTIVDCSFVTNSLRAVRVVANSELINCTATGGQTGIMVGDGCTIRGNTSSGHFSGFVTGTGIYVLGTDNVIEDNVCNDNTYGMLVEAAGNTIRRNACSGSQIMNWSIVVGNNLAPIIVATPNNVAITGNSYGGNMGSVDPAANYTY